MPATKIQITFSFGFYTVAISCLKRYLPRNGIVASLRCPEFCAASAWSREPLDYMPARPVESAFDSIFVRRPQLCNTLPRLVAQPEQLPLALLGASGPRRDSCMQGSPMMGAHRKRASQRLRCPFDLRAWSYLPLSFLRRFLPANPAETMARLVSSRRGDLPGGVGLKPILRR